MSITITSTHEKSKGEHTIELTEYIVNLFSNILELDGTTTDLAIPNNINYILKHENRINIEHKELFKLFGIKQYVKPISAYHRLYLNM